jgi:hypothetical protein
MKNIPTFEDFVNESIINEGYLSPKDANKLRIGSVIKTKAETYTVIAYGQKTNATRDLSAENEKGEKFNLRVSLRGAAGISVASGNSLNFNETPEMLESLQIDEALAAASPSKLTVREPLTRAVQLKLIGDARKGILKMMKASDGESHFWNPKTKEYVAFTKTYNGKGEYWHSADIDGGGNLMEGVNEDFDVSKMKVKDTIELKNSRTGDVGTYTIKKILGGSSNIKEIDLLNRSNQPLTLYYSKERGLQNFKGDVYECITESALNEGWGMEDIKEIHFETDPNKQLQLKKAYGKKTGAMSSSSQIASADYALAKFRREIKYDNGKSGNEGSLDVFIPNSSMAVFSTLGNGPHAKKQKAHSWTKAQYNKWIKDMSGNGGADNAYDMAQNAKFEPGLLDWVKKNICYDETPLERIQWDIEAYS